MCRQNVSTHSAVPMTSPALNVVWADVDFLQVSLSGISGDEFDQPISDQTQTIKESLEVCSSEVCTAQTQIVPKSARPICIPYSIYTDGPKLLVFWQMVLSYARSAWMSGTSRYKRLRHSIISKSEIIVLKLAVLYSILLTEMLNSTN